MSSIEKLLIRGIRSFSPDSQNVIEFYTPVTIIVGHNGAGKTTVIECLKYATTGDLPPNAKGGAFVHDPKLSGDSDVKAQIRLKFRNVKGQSMVVTRSMQSTQKKNNKLEQKSLEGLLVTTDQSTGEQVSISTRCAELDSEIPLHLGVSRAVLENVIFCHQEESFWPLSEPSILKKKFDDIFSATRYTKALDTLKALKKDLTSDLKLEMQKLEFLQSEQEKGRRVEANLRSCEGQIGEIRSKIQSLDLQIDSVSSLIDRSSNDLLALSSLIGEVERLEHDLKITEQNRIDLVSSLGSENSSQSQVELEAQLERLLSRVKDAQKTMHEYESKRNEILSKIESLTKDYSLNCTHRGTLQARVDVIDGKLKDRNGLLQHLASMLSINYSTQHEQLMMSIADKIQIQRDRLISLKEEISTEDSQKQQQIQSNLGKHIGLEELRRSRRKQIDEIQEGLLKIEETLSSDQFSKNINQINDDFQEEMEIASEETELSFLKDKAGQSRDIERQINELQRQRKESEGEQDRCQRDLMKFNQSAEIRARLSLKSSEISKKEELLQRLWSEYSSNPTSSPQFEIAEKEFDQIQRERTMKLKSSQEKNDSALRDLSLSCSKLEHLRSQITKKESDLKELQSKISLKLPDSSSIPIETRIRPLEAELNSIKEKESVVMSSSSVYGTLLESMNHCEGEAVDCPVCEQSMEKGLKNRIQQKLENLSDGTKQREELSVKRQELEAKLNVILPLRPLQQEIDRLRSSELPELRAELTAFEDQESRARIISEEAQLDTNSLIVEEKRAALVKRKIDDGLRLSRELQTSLHERQSMQDSLGIEAGGASDPEKLENALQNSQTRSRQLLDSIEKLTREARAKEAEQIARENRLRDRREAFMKNKMQRAERDRLIKSQQEQKEALNKFTVEVHKIQSDLELSTNSLKHLREDRDIWFKKANERLEVAQSSLDTALVPFSQLDALQAEIERLQEQSNGDSGKELAELERSIASIESKITMAQEELQDLQANASKSSKEAAEVQLKERTLRDNLRVKELEGRIQQIEAQLSIRQERLHGIDRNTLQLNHSKAQMKKSDLMGERAGLVGELRQLEENSGRLRSELDGDYAHVMVDWQKQMIKVKAIQLGSDDLEKYSKALDQAIMKYHALKMDDINTIIKELWTTTYQGSDIDTVEIRADHESGAAGTAISGRAYNYRVIMKKGSVELDMRGRSSAGQRVLTCLIIRLALAEVFGLHCGILALDEPTTNLDRENIAALAASLANIIRTRRSQSNFQLILITHDEEFVQLLGRFECAEYYWRIFKDESQHSCIERQSISGVLE